MDNFLEQLAQTIRDVGQELIDQAEDIAGRNPMLSRMTITICFDPETSMLLPTIEVNKEYLCRNAFERQRMRDEEEQNG